MRILYVGWGFSPFHTGGSVRYAEAVMAAMAGRGHACAYFCAGRFSLLPKSSPSLRRWNRDGVALYEVFDSPILPTWGVGTKDPGTEIRSPMLAGLLRDAVRDFRPDLIHIHELNALSADLVEVLKEFEAPVCCSLHDFGPVCPTFFLYKYDRAVCRDYQEGEDCVRCSAQAPARSLAFRLALGLHSAFGARGKGIVQALSSTAKALFRSTAERAAPPGEGAAAGFVLRREAFSRALSRVDLLLPVSGRVAILYAGYGVSAPAVRVLHPVLPHHDRLCPAAGGGRSGGKVRLGYIGGLIPAKGIEVLLDAHGRMAEKGNVELALHGVCDPAYRRELARRFPGGMAGYQGAFEPDRLGEILGAIDVGVFPSVCEETYGLVAVEFQHAGIPVVASRTGGIPEVIRDGENGILVHPGDSAALAAALDRLVRDPRMRDALAGRAVRSPTFTEHLDVLESIYGNLRAGGIGGGRGGEGAVIGL
jgi:glycosyltransferase involved in cell wall biosynthesis